MTPHSGEVNVCNPCTSGRIKEMHLEQLHKQQTEDINKFKYPKYHVYMPLVVMIPSFYRFGKFCGFFSFFFFFFFVFIFFRTGDRSLKGERERKRKKNKILWQKFKFTVSIFCDCSGEFQSTLGGPLSQQLSEP